MTDTPKGPRARARRHDWIDERSRALHARIAGRIRAQPELVNAALENLDRWERRRGVQPALSEWRSLLQATELPELLELLIEDSERADRLRQSSPFKGILPSEERLAVFRHHETL